GQHLELEAHAALLALLAVGVLARRAIDARLEMQIAEAALAASRDERTHAILRQIGDDLARFGVRDHGSDRHAQHDVVRGATVLIGAAAPLAVFRAVNARVTVIDQRVDVAVGDGKDAATAAAVAAVGPTAGYIFFA